IHMRVQSVLDEARPPMYLRRRRVNKGDARSALEVPYGGRVAIDSSERWDLDMNVDAKGCQRVGNGEHVPNTRSGQGGHGPQKSRAQCSTEHRRAHRGSEKLPARK